MYLQKVISEKLRKKIFFVGILKFTDEKSRIWIFKSLVRIRGSGSVSKCHGSITLVLCIIVVTKSHPVTILPVTYRYPVQFMEEESN
jgi:hypothetical protein